MKVQYINEGEYEGTDMTIGKIYEVIGMEADSYRIVNDCNMPFLYDPKQFEIVSNCEPDFWVTKFGEGGERYAYPTTWNHAGFFEDFHDNVTEVVNQFWSEHKSLYGNGANV
jgi:hypothetical protein